MSDTLINSIINCVNAVIDFLVTACNDGVVPLFISGDSLSAYGVFSVVVFALSVVLYFANRLINYFVRF